MVWSVRHGELGEATGAHVCPMSRTGSLVLGAPRRDSCPLQNEGLLASSTGYLSGCGLACLLVHCCCTNQNSNLCCLKSTICSDEDRPCVNMSPAGIGSVVDIGHTLNQGCCHDGPVRSFPRNLSMAGQLLGATLWASGCCWAYGWPLTTQTLTLCAQLRKESLAPPRTPEPMEHPPNSSCA